MPITFGSVGDIISICLVVKDLVEVLKKAKDSSQEFQELTAELWVLERALLEVDLLSRTCNNTAELTALCETARRTAEKCQFSMESFSAKLKKYSGTLSGGGSGSVLRDASMKIRWQMSYKDEVARFRAEVCAHSSSINMLLLTASVTLSKINDTKLHQRWTDAERKRHDSSNEQHALLLQVKNKIDENNRLVEAGNTISTKLARTFRFEWFRQLGVELKYHMRRIYRLNIATYNAVLAIQAGLPNYLERSLIQEPFILEDAVGRIAPVHTQFINSWEAFDSILELRFRSFPGHSKVQDKEYVFQEHATRREIDRSRPWEASFLPGQRVDMSMVFKGSAAAISTCPNCHLPADGSTMSDVECAGCNTWFRRITEYDEVDLPIPGPIPTPATRKEKVAFGQNPFRDLLCGPEPPSNLRNKRKLENDEVGQLASFKRIRIVSRKSRYRKARVELGPFSQWSTTAAKFNVQDITSSANVPSNSSSIKFIFQDALTDGSTIREGHETDSEDDDGFNEQMDQDVEDDSDASLLMLHQSEEVDDPLGKGVDTKSAGEDPPNDLNSGVESPTEDERPAKRRRFSLDANLYYTGTKPKQYLRTLEDFRIKHRQTPGHGYPRGV